MTPRPPMIRRVVLLVLLMALAPGPARPATVAADSLAAPAAKPVRYQLGLLTRGPAWTAEHSARTDSIQAGHMANIGRMAEKGALLAAGPFVRGGEYAGVFVFAPDAPGLDTLLALDPAISSQRLLCTLYPWIAPANLGDDYRRRAEALDRTSEGVPDSMVTFGWVMMRRGSHYDSNPTPSVQKLLARHHDYIKGLRASGRLVYAGDIEGTGELRGVLVMQGDSVQVSHAVFGDPAVRAKRFVPQILRWWTAWGTIPGH